MSPLDDLRAHDCAAGMAHHRLDRRLLMRGAVAGAGAVGLGSLGVSAAAAPTSPQARPPRPLRLTGDTQVHDPALVRERRRGDWYVFSTGDPEIAGGTVQVRRSADQLTWASAGTVWDAIPAWVQQDVPGVSNLWAPDLYRHGGTWYLYYAASTFGSNHSVIGLATNTTLDPDDPAHEWVDRGAVVRSTDEDDYNAIDAGVVEDADGTPWLAFGSFWSGVRMVRLRWPSGKAAPGQGPPLRLADRRVPPNAIEAPYIVRHGGWFYLFVSFDSCCQGTESTYKVAVGRSRSVTGPYHDRLGTPLLHGGGTVILSENGPMVGPGGQSVWSDWLAHHYYDARADGAPRLSIRRIEWRHGWPRVSTRAPVG